MEGFSKVQLDRFYGKMCDRREDRQRRKRVSEIEREMESDTEIEMYSCCSNIMVLSQNMYGINIRHR